ncbi:aminoglycoside phosphotransferase [Actinomycetospora lutea]|uniref:maltokinase N-terminal cap-like domain-containing protein n=1 Tax=Actinomycetospora lutea TaxID=663604 RepID=UPI00236616D8|nr:aminoglycoside phosphotransferase [Actinomycetospora lutea]MDD7942125.1 aminoglycoside phosphotransferase [Actinomycetospora lutea]
MPATSSPDDPLAGLHDALLAWLPSQRWFPAKGREIAGLRTVGHAVVSAPGESPTVEHAVIGVSFADASGGSAEERYQLVLGVQASPPADVEYAVIGRRDGDVVYDGLADGRISRLFLSLITENATRGPLRFVAEPDTEAPIVGPGRPLIGEQSNSSVIYGERAIMKLFRRATAGLNPDLELHRALRRQGSREVAPLLGAIEGELDGEPMTVAMLQGYASNSADGWSMAAASVRDLLAEADLRADEVGGDFAGEAHRIGKTVAAVHLELAAALGTQPLDARGASEIEAWMLERLDRAAAAVPGVAEQRDAIADVLRGVTAAEPSTLQRIHGDLHLGQELRTPTGWLVIDFEGEPSKPLADRVRPDSPMRDVAAMLRSFDYAAFHQLSEWEQSADDPDPQLERRAQEWADRNRSAFCDGYAEVSGTDPRDVPELLRAYELDKAVYEVLYETRNRPGWVSIPLRSMRRLLTPAGRGER